MFLVHLNETLFQVQIRTYPCGSYSPCACAIVAREGNDLVEIDKTDPQLKIAIKPTSDDRYPGADLNIIAHSKLQYPAMAINADELLGWIPTIRRQKFKTVAIDEGHFFKDLAQFCIMADFVDQIIISTIDYNFELEQMGPTWDVINQCNHVTVRRMTADCECGRPTRSEYLCG